MKRIGIALCTAVAAVLFASAFVRAEDNEWKPPTVVGKATSEVEEMKAALAKLVDINAMVATTYTYGFNKPSSGLLGYEVINKDNNTFALYDAFLQIARNRDDEDFGFTVNMDFGETAKFTGSDWNGNGLVAAPLDNTEEGNAFELREAYGTYKVPWDGIKFKAGKFVTLLGYEVLMTNTAYNPNLSHSILFGYGINFTNVGFLFDIPLGDKVTVDIAAINGWDEAVDNNNSKTLMAGLGLKAADFLSFYLAGTYGSEQNGVNKTWVDSSGATVTTPGFGAGSKRGVVTLNGTWTTPLEGLSVIMDSVYGNESDIPAGALPNGATSASWLGVVGYVNYAPAFDPLTGLSFNLRAEVFDDVDGTRLPGSYSPNLPFGTPQTVEELTATVGYQFNPHILARLEYRYDTSDRFGYVTDVGAAKLANTIATEFIVAF